MFNQKIFSTSRKKCSIYLFSYQWEKVVDINSVVYTLEVYLLYVYLLLSTSFFYHFKLWFTCDNCCSVLLWVLNIPQTLIRFFQLYKKWDEKEIVTFNIQATSSSAKKTSMSQMLSTYNDGFPRFSSRWHFSIVFTLLAWLGSRLTPTEQSLIKKKKTDALRFRTNDRNISNLVVEK